MVDGQLLARPAGYIFDARVTYATRTTTLDIASGEVVTKAIAIQTQGVQSVRTAALEMDAVTSMNTRLREAPDVHLVLSWRGGERPTPDEAFVAGGMALSALGAGDHQYVMAIHADTENVHLHIVFNRVDPQTFRALDMYRDYEKLDRACREIELRQGWSLEQSDKAMHRVQNGVIERVYRERDADVPAPLGSRGDTARAYADQPLFTEWVRNVSPELKAYLGTPDASWAGVHAKLAEFNLRLEAKNYGRTAGLIVVDRDDPTRVAQAGQIAYFARRGKLEAVLGAFEPDRHQPLEPATAAIEAPSIERNDVLEAPAEERATSELTGYGRYLVDDDDRQRAQRGVELAANPRLLVYDLFSRSATITTADIDRAIAGDVANAEQARSVWSGLRALVDAGELIALDAPLTVNGDAGTEPAGVRWTTPAMLAREATLRDAIDALAAAPPCDPLTVDAVELDALGFRAAQRTAADRILSGERLVPIEGHAGVGKSYVFKRVFEIVRQHAPQRSQLGIAQGGQAAAELAESTGLRAMTIAAFARAVRSGELSVDEQTDLILDEANLVGTYDMHDVTAIALESGARLLVAGDNSQLPAVAAGGAFALLTNRVPTTSLDDVVRQTGWRREAAELARSGETIAAAVEQYAKHGCLHQRQTSADAVEHAVDLWMSRGEPYPARLLLAFRNDDVDALNLEARVRLRARGDIGEAVFVTTKRYAEREFGVGDRIIFRANEYAELDVRNGMLGTVVALDDGMLRVRIDGTAGREVIVDPKRYNDIGYGYALASYAAEGKTADYCVALMTRADFQASAYVALSRTRGEGDVVIAQDEFTFARPGGDSRPQDYQTNLAFILKRERVKDLASSYKRSDRASTLREPADAHARYTMRPATGDTSTIRRQTGQRQFDQWFVRDVGADLRIVLADPKRNWERVHAVLEANGVRAIRSNRGLVYADTHDERWRCKASALPKRFSLGGLEALLGRYAPPDVMSPDDRAFAIELRDRRVAAERDEGRDENTRPLRIGNQRNRTAGRVDDHGAHRRSHRVDRAARIAQRSYREEPYAQFCDERDRRLRRSEAWQRQRSSEFDRHLAITENKRAIKGQWISRGYGARAAASIATAYGYEQREALRSTIAEERAALRATLDNEPARSWRQFMANVAAPAPAAAAAPAGGPSSPTIDPAQAPETIDSTSSGEPTATDLTRDDRDMKRVTPTPGPEMSDGQREDRADEPSSRSRIDRDASATRQVPGQGPTLETSSARDPEKRETPGLRHRVYENGDVGYRFNDIASRVFGGDAFRDRGSRITLEDNSDRAIRAAIGYAREKFGNEAVTLYVTAGEREKVLRAAVKAGLNIKNPEMQRDIERIREGQAKNVFARIDHTPRREKVTPEKSK